LHKLPVFFHLPQSIFAFCGEHNELGSIVIVNVVSQSIHVFVRWWMDGSMWQEYLWNVFFFPVFLTLNNSRISSNFTPKKLLFSFLRNGVHWNTGGHKVKILIDSFTYSSNPPSFMKKKLRLEVLQLLFGMS